MQPQSLQGGSSWDTAAFQGMPASLFQSLSCGILLLQRKLGRRRERNSESEVRGQGENAELLRLEGRETTENNSVGELSLSVSMPLPCLLKLGVFAFSFSSTS